ncbi:MAG: hypothetical protein HON94_12460 [Methylococcales bacterium]|jgi:hypothetical protein|nr:hypothetical protein [Methylococcales bacterium]MBT7409890.1 hypothetical protein [Methylococcales bacterium]
MNKKSSSFFDLFIILYRLFKATIIRVTNKKNRETMRAFDSTLPENKMKELPELSPHSAPPPAFYYDERNSILKLKNNKNNNESD